MKTAVSINHSFRIARSFLLILMILMLSVFATSCKKDAPKPVITSSLLITPSIVDFGTVYIGSATQVHLITLKNISTSAVKLVSYIPTGVGLTIDNDTCTDTLSVNEECDIKASLVVPATAGAYDGSINVTTSVASYDIPVTAMVSAEKSADIQFFDNLGEPLDLELVTSAIGKTHNKLVIVKNVGNYQLDIATIEPQLVAGEILKIDDGKQTTSDQYIKTNNCIDNNIAPDKTCAFMIITDSTSMKSSDKFTGHVAISSIKKSTESTAIATAFPVNINVTTPIFKQISVSENRGQHILALTDDGDVYSWGSNLFGQLGDNTTTNVTTLKVVKFPTGTAIKEVSAGRSHSLALTTDNRLYAWGKVTDKQLAIDPAECTDAVTEADTCAIPVLANMASDANGNVKGDRLGTGASKIKHIYAGTVVSYALMDNGTLYGWGKNNSGILGKDTTVAEVTYAIPVTPDTIIYNANNQDINTTPTGTKVSTFTSVSINYESENKESLLLISNEPACKTGCILGATNKLFIRDALNVANVKPINHLLSPRFTTLAGDKIFNFGLNSRLFASETGVLYIDDITNRDNNNIYSPNNDSNKSMISTGATSGILGNANISNALIQLNGTAGIKSISFFPHQSVVYFDDGRLIAWGQSATTATDIIKNINNKIVDFKEKIPAGIKLFASNNINQFIAIGEDNKIYGLGSDGDPGSTNFIFKTSDNLDRSGELVQVFSDLY